MDKQIHQRDSINGEEPSRSADGGDADESKVSAKLKSKDGAGEENDEEGERSDLFLDLGAGAHEEEEVEGDVDEAGVEELRQ